MSEQKGLRYNTNKKEWGLLHYKSLENIIDVLMYGAHKYSIFKDDDGKEIKGVDITPEEASKLILVSSGKNNWQLGLDKRQILESMQRHLAALLDGEEIDKESLLHHIGHIGCNYLFYSFELLKEQRIADFQ